MEVRKTSKVLTGTFFSVTGFETVTYMLQVITYVMLNVYCIRLSI